MIRTDYRIFPWLKHLPGEHKQSSHAGLGSVTDLASKEKMLKKELDDLYAGPETAAARRKASDLEKQLDTVRSEYRVVKEREDALLHGNRTTKHRIDVTSEFDETPALRKELKDRIDHLDRSLRYAGADFPDDIRITVAKKNELGGAAWALTGRNAVGVGSVLEKSSGSKIRPHPAYVAGVLVHEGAHAKQKSMDLPTREVDAANKSAAWATKKLKTESDKVARKWLIANIADQDQYATKYESKSKIKKSFKYDPTDFKDDLG